MKSKVISRVAALIAATLSVVIAALLVAPTFAGAQAGPRAVEHADSLKPTIVLVHGGWADGSSWDHVISILQHEGYTVERAAEPAAGSRIGRGRSRQLSHDNFWSNHPGGTLLRWCGHHQRRDRKPERQGSCLRRRL